MKNLALMIVFVGLSYSPTSSAWFGPDNYAECIFAEVNPTIPPRGIAHIETQCRQRFPEPSNTLFAADTTQTCYNKHQALASSPAAAKAIWKACHDYQPRPTSAPVQ